MNDELIKELIDTLKNQKRPETVNVPVYGLYSADTKTFLYSDNNKQYDYVREYPTDKTVRSVKAFAQSIAEELKRRNNATGLNATVSINLNGGFFIPDDDFGGYHINFNRLNSQQWTLIKDYINKTVYHREFLLLLQGLKPSFKGMGINFNEFFSKFAQLKLIGQSKLTSNPIITNDGQQEGYTCVYKLQDGTDGEEHFPTGFTISVPFAKAGEHYYDLDIDLLFSRDENDKITITILCPEFENIEEKAIIDEAKYIKDETLKYSELLVLSDF